MSELACLDGHVAAAEETFVPATDEGLLRGDGVFEVIRVYDGVPFALDAHLERMKGSAANLRLDMPDADLLQREALDLLAARGGGFGGMIRIVLTRGGRRLLLTEQLPPHSERARLALVTYSPPRILDGVKSLSYAGNMLASRLARERGFDEALLVTPHGRALEAPTSSIFWVAPDGAVCTVPLEEHVLASITRDRVMRLVGAEERPATVEDLRAATEAFLASTTREVQAIAAIEDHEYLDGAGERTREAAELLRRHIDDELRAFSG